MMSDWIFKNFEARRISNYDKFFIKIEDSESSYKYKVFGKTLDQYEEYFSCFKDCDSARKYISKLVRGEWV
jgi:hypothetical protein